MHADAYAPLALHVLLVLGVLLLVIELWAGYRRRRDLDPELVALEALARLCRRDVPP
jgi:hypothetical protein